MDKKIVTMEMFEQYHKLLVQYITMRDDLIIKGQTTCPNCGEEITSYKCGNCGKDYKNMLQLENLLGETE